MRTRSTITLTLVAALTLLATTSAVGTVNQYKDRPLDRQNLGYLRAGTTTRATTFGPLAGWGPSDSMHVDARGGIAATLSVSVSGGPVEFRMFLEDVEDEWKVQWMKPSFAAFDPGTGTASTSFTWVAAVQPGTYTVNVAWRSPTGAQLTIQGGSLVVQYGQR